MSENKTSRNADGVYEPFMIENVPWESSSHGERFGMRYRQLGNYGGGSHVGVCYEELAPGKQTCPAHYHMLEEEHLLVLEGSLRLRLGQMSAAEQIFRDVLAQMRYQIVPAHGIGTSKKCNRHHAAQLVRHADDRSHFDAGVQ